MRDKGENIVKKSTILVTFMNIIYIAIFMVVTIFSTQLQKDMKLNLYLGESHAGARNIAKLFYSDDRKDWKKNGAVTVVFEDDTISYPVNEIDFTSNEIRLDPVNKKENFSVCRMELIYDKYVVWTLSGDQFAKYVDKVRCIEDSVHRENYQCTVKTQNPRLIMKKKFSDKIASYNWKIGVLPYIVLAFLYVGIGLCEWHILHQDKGGNKVWERIRIAVTGILVSLGVASVYALHYFVGHFGQVPFGQLVYHLHTPLEGTDISSYQEVIWLGVGVSVGTGVIFGIICWLTKRWNRQGVIQLWGIVLGVLLMCYGGIKACYHFDIPEYYAYTHASTSLYEDYYVDGREVDITFPRQKRNLIYIFLESMEVTYADAASGGSMADNYIPELTTLGLENETFSDGTSLNGAHQISGATYTMGGLAAQTCGVPINENMVSNDTLNGTWESENNYLPGVWSIGDILHDAGYNQEFLIGSNGNFAGRASYFRGHGEYDVEDYNKALEDGRIPKDYKVWWGYEDQKLFQFAKEDVTKLADENKPFNMTLLTVDTHFTDGYVCDLCEENFNVQYSNVLACSSRQVADFVEWVQQQDFYENTTIVIAGDHLTPDSYYIANEGANGFDRRTYVTIINPAEGKHSEKVNRTYTTMDLFPTTLSAMGVEIEGDRLGLGVDLYSGKQTLVEEMGLDALNTELLKNSDYYTKKLLYEK